MLHFHLVENALANAAHARQKKKKKNSRGSKASVNIQSQHLSSYANICATLFANIERPALVVIGDSDVKTQTSFHPTFFFFSDNLPAPSSPPSSCTTTVDCLKIV